jgi:hypothetical protein
MNLMHEATRATREGIKVSQIERIERWVGKNCFFHMSEFNKIGINPRSKWTAYGAPLGIYGFPLNHENFALLSQGKLMFASRRFAHVFRPIDGIKILTNEIDDETFEKYVQLIKYEYTVLEKKMGASEFDDAVKFVIKTSVIKTNAEYLWTIMKELTGSPLKFRNLFLKLGIDAFYDKGDGIIDEGKIRSQAVFFKSSSIEQLDTVEWPVKAYERQSKL